MLFMSKCEVRQIKKIGNGELDSEITGLVCVEKIIALIPKTQITYSPLKWHLIPKRSSTFFIHRSINTHELSNDISFAKQSLLFRWPTQPQKATKHIKCGNDATMKNKNKKIHEKLYLWSFTEFCFCSVWFIINYYWLSTHSKLLLRRLFRHLPTKRKKLKQYFVVFQPFNLRKAVAYYDGCITNQADCWIIYQFLWYANIWISWFFSSSFKKMSEFGRTLIWSNKVLSW